MVTWRIDVIMRLGSIVLILLTSGWTLSEVMAQSTLANSDLGTIPYQRIHSDGEQILITQTEVIPGKTVQIPYTVQVPIQTNQGVEYRTENRIRVVPATKQRQVAAGVEYSFFTLDQKPIDKESLAKRISGNGKIVVVLRGAQKIPLEWEQLLKKETVIMRIDR